MQGGNRATKEAKAVRVYLKHYYNNVGSVPWQDMNSEGGGGMNQAYSLLSTTHGHITDCKLDSVVYAGVYVVS